MNFQKKDFIKYLVLLALIMPIVLTVIAVVIITTKNYNYEDNEAEDADELYSVNSLDSLTQKDVDAKKFLEEAYDTLKENGKNFSMDVYEEKTSKNTQMLVDGDNILATLNNNNQSYSVLIFEGITYIQWQDKWYSVQDQSDVDLLIDISINDSLSSLLTEELRSQIVYKGETSYDQEVCYIFLLNEQLAMFFREDDYALVKIEKYSYDTGNLEVIIKYSYRSEKISRPQYVNTVSKDEIEKIIDEVKSSMLID